MHAELAKGFVGPKALARALNEPLASVIYHFAVLEEAGLVVAGTGGLQQGGRI